MDGLVEKVALIVAENGSRFEMPTRDIARAAIEAVFDALAEPSGDAIGAATFGFPSERITNWKAMLATLRKQALG